MSPQKKGHRRREGRTVSAVTEDSLQLRWNYMCRLPSSKQINTGLLAASPQAGSQGQEDEAWLNPATWHNHRASYLPRAMKTLKCPRLALFISMKKIIMARLSFYPGHCCFLTCFSPLTGFWGFSYSLLFLLLFSLPTHILKGLLMQISNTKGKWTFLCSLITLNFICGAESATPTWRDILRSN